MLNIMKQGQDLTDVTVRILNGMRDVFKAVSYTHLNCVFP